MCDNLPSPWGKLSHDTPWSKSQIVASKKKQIKKKNIKQDLHLQNIKVISSRLQGFSLVNWLNRVNNFENCDN